MALTLEQIDAEIARRRSSAPKSNPIVDENRNQNFIENLGEGLATGAKSRALGVLQYGMESTPLKRVFPETYADTEALASKYRQESVGTGVGGAIGEILGDPLTAATLPVAPAATGLRGLAAIGLGTGLVEGMTGSKTDDETRLGKMATSGGIGLAGGAILGKASEEAPRLAGWLSSKLAGTAPSVKLNKAEKLIYSRLKKDIPDDAELLATLRQYQTAQSEQPLVMKGGKMTESLARGAAQLESGRAATEFATDETAKRAPEAFENMLKRTISPNFSTRDAAQSLAEEAQKVASPLYKKAFKANPVVASDRLNRVLSTPAARQAIKETMVDTQNSMQLAAKPDPALGMVARELLGMDVEGGVSRGFSLRTLNQIKKKMDKKISAGLRSTNTADREAAESMMDAKNALLDELDVLDKTGSYAKARATRADIYDIENALEDGRAFFTMQGKNALTTEDLGKQFTSYTPQQQKAYKIGMMQDIMAKVRNVQEGGNPTRFLKTPAVQKRLETVLGDDYQKVMQQADIVSKTYEIRNKVLGGSPTSANQMAREAFGEIDPADIQDVLRGSPINFAMRKVAEKAMRAKMGLDDKAAGEVSDILFATDPKKRFAFAKKLQNVVNSKQVNQDARNQARQKMEAFFALDQQLGEFGDAAVKTSRYVTPQGITDAPNDTSGYGDSVGASNSIPDNSASGGVSQPPITLDAIEQEIQRRKSQVAPQSSLPQDIRQDEGLRYGAYQDTTGNRTVGMGFNMDSGIAKKIWRKAGVQAKFDDVYNGMAQISPMEAEALGGASFAIAADDAVSLYPNLNALSQPRQEALLNLSYQIGKTKLKDFERFNAAVNRGNWTEAARHLLKSQYAQQTKGRAQEVARKLLRG